MVAQPGTKQANFNSGEVSEKIDGRYDLKFYYAAASLMQNVEPAPQGGYGLLPGMRFGGYTGRMVADAFAATPTAVTRSAAGLVLSIDTGASRAIAAVTLTGLKADAQILAALQVEVSDDPGVTGQLLGPALALTTDPRTVRVAAAPGAPVTGRYLRLVLAVTPPAPLLITAGVVTAHTESFGLAARVRGFNGSNGVAYSLTLAPGHADVWRAGAWCGSFPFPYTGDQLADLQLTQRFDTALIWHPAEAPRRIIRAAGDGDWQLDAVPFENVPIADLGGVYTNAIAEEWDVYITWSASPVAEHTFTLNIDGEPTAAIEIAAPVGGGWADWGETALRIAAAINALPSTPQPGGVTVSLVSNYNYAATFRVVFGGNSKGSTHTMTGSVLSATWIAVNTGRMVVGKPAGEPIFSAARGWPGCGVFYQDRLFVGGFPAKPSAYAASQTGEYYQYNTDIAAAAGPILDNLDTEGAERIVQIIQSKYLIFLTDRNMCFLSSRVIDRTQPRNIASSETYGAAANIPVVTKAEGGFIYANRAGSMLLTASYSAVDEGFSTQPLTLLASHLLTGSEGESRVITDMAGQEPADESDALRLWITRDDGLLVAGQVIRDQDVTAFVRRVTEGKVRSVTVDADNVVNLVVERQVNGMPRLTYERLEAGLLLDQALDVPVPAPLTVVTGLDALEGATVWALADGYVEGPFTVTGGSVTLPEPALASLTVGRWTPPRMRTLPISKVVGEANVVLNRPARVHTVVVDLLDTTSIAVGANDRPPRNQPLQRMGWAGDAPPRPRTGEITVAGLSGFSEQGIVEVTQTRPGKLRVRSITPEAKT